MTDAHLQPLNESEFSYGQILSVLFRRWPWVLAALSLALAAAVYKARQEEPTYKSSMQMIVEPNFEQNLRIEDYQGLDNTPPKEQDYLTQLTLMRSDQFLDQAVQQLKKEYPDLSVDSVKKQFTLYRVEEDKESTRIFQAVYVDNDPVKTQRFLETLQSVYLKFNEERQAKRLIQGLEHINKQLINTRENLQSAQSSLERFRQGENLIDPSLQAQAVTESLNRVQEEQRQLIADFNATEDRYKSLSSRLSLAPETALVASRLSESTRVQSLLTKLQETNLALADRRIIFTDEDPSVQVLVEQRDNQLAALRQEISAIIRKPVSELDSSTLALLQLGKIDLSLVTQLLEADVSLKSIQARWQTLTELEKSLRQEVNRYPSLIAEYDRLQPAVEIERNTLQQLLQQREALSSELARGGFTWEVVEAPTLGQQLGPDPVRPIALGLVAGLFAGGALAFLVESMDKVVRTSDELKKQVALPLLGILPMQTGRWSVGIPLAKRDANQLIPSLHPELADSDLAQTILWQPFRESLDLIANNLQLLKHERTPKSIAVTSGVPGEGKTTLTLGMALSLARMSQKVLVIDADLRRSGIQTQLGLDLQGGLSSFLTGQQASIRPHRLDFGTCYVDVLPAGPAPVDPIILLSSPRFQKLLARSKEVYDLVLIDTPPVLGMADAVKVGAVSDGTVLVTRLDRITQPELTEVLSLLAPIKVLGIVANGAKGKSSRYSSYTSRVYSTAASNR
ncbi:MAG TPA: polysaccharide biosynthesis tyrosine autokinase [Trichocoleus sp.]